MGFIGRISKFLNFGTSQVRNFEFGTPIVRDKSNLTDDKISTMSVEGTNFKILGALAKFGTVKDGNFKFGTYIDLSKSHITDDKISPKEAWLESRGRIFKFWHRPSICNLRRRNFTLVKHRYKSLKNIEEMVTRNTFCGTRVSVPLLKK